VIKTFSIIYRIFNEKNFFMDERPKQLSHGGEAIVIICI
jgi:hypothetical protein